MTLPLSADTTEVGSYFVANYPPFSFWRPEALAQARAVIESPTADGSPLGLYLHVPFCRKRCKFCYFRVYTDKNAREIERYVAALSREVDIWSRQPAIAGRRLGFVYFGGGTPSYLSAQQLRSLVDRLRESVDWDGADEVTFECEPGTLNERKLEAIREIGVTRLSLGIESLDDGILAENGRAHRSAECLEAYAQARRIGFEQINVDLIAGMVGETDENWRDSVARTVALEPDCATIYQMELPFNTVYSREGAAAKQLVADWRTKRRWVDEAFAQFEGAGYSISSAYTVVRDSNTRFVYRDALWRGADLIGAGVASFGHIQGVHVQNLDGFEPYIERLEAGELPLGRALTVTEHQRLVREFVLQLKKGSIDVEYFRAKFGVDVRQEFAPAIDAHRAAGWFVDEDDSIRLTRAGLLRVDSLLEPFFEPAHRNARYT